MFAFTLIAFIVSFLVKANNHSKQLKMHLDESEEKCSRDIKEKYRKLHDSRGDCGNLHQEIIKLKNKIK